MTKVLGIAGWSGSGKTTLLTRLIPVLVSRNQRVATLKHAHHSFDVDQPGKDSYEHRKAGAAEVIISSARRWVQMHEVGAGPELTLSELLTRVSPCDLVLVEGFKSAAFPKIEIFRPSLGKSPLYLEDRAIVAVASDQPLSGTDLPYVSLNDVRAVADLVIAKAEPIEVVIAGLNASGA